MIKANVSTSIGAVISQEQSGMAILAKSVRGQLPIEVRNTRPRRLLSSCTALPTEASSLSLTYHASSPWEVILGWAAPQLDGNMVTQHQRSPARRLEFRQPSRGLECKRCLRLDYEGVTHPTMSEAPIMQTGYFFRPSGYLTRCLRHGTS